MLHRKRRRTLSVAWVVPLVVLALVAGAIGGIVGARLTKDDHLADAGLPVAADGAGTVERAPDSVAGIAAGGAAERRLDPGRRAAGQRHRLGLRAARRRLPPHQQPRRSRRRRQAASTTITVTFVDGSEQRRARSSAAPSDYDLAVLKVDVDGPRRPLAARRLRRRRGRGRRRRRRCAARPRRHRDHGHRQRAQPAGVRRRGDRDGPPVHQRDPDRRRDQPRQLRRPAGRTPRARSSASTPRSPSRPGVAPRVVGGSIGLGFAIPSNQVRRTADQLIETGHATYPIIGVLLDRPVRRRGRAGVATTPGRPAAGHRRRPGRPRGHPPRRRHPGDRRPPRDRPRRAHRGHPRADPGRHDRAARAQRAPRARRPREARRVATD